MCHGIHISPRINEIKKKVSHLLQARQRGECDPRLPPYAMPVRHGVRELEDSPEESAGIVVNLEP